MTWTGPETNGAIALAGPDEPRSEVTSKRAPPGVGLEFCGRATGDHLPTVDDHDLVGELVGFVEILRREQSVAPSVDESADNVPTSGLGWWGRVRSSVRPERAGRPRDQSPAARSRRLRIPPEYPVRTRSAASADRTVEQLGGTGSRHGASQAGRVDAIMTRFCRPVRSPSTWRHPGGDSDIRRTWRGFVAQTS